jgi:uncharacterized membrane protein YgcG
MISSRRQQALSLILSFLMVLVTLPLDAGAVALYQDQSAVPPPSSTPSYSGQGTPMTAEELQSLVAPIALYPDSLVAQILNAATFPDQIAVANYWLEQNKSLTGSALMKAVDGQSWDPSVKALTQFPAVLNNMAQNLTWTSQLGEAYHNQQADVMTAIQTLRAQAKAAGNLKSTPQMTVVQQSPQVIVIQPANPQVVYVPTYNPTVVYGTPYVVPGYSTGDLVATELLSFGAGIAVGAMMSGGCCGWGWSSWNCNWYHGGAYYHGYPYYGNNAWHGGYYGGYNDYGNHPYNGYNNYNHSYNGGYNSNGYHANNYNSGYNHTGDTSYNRNTNVSGNTVNVNRDASGSNSWDKSGGWGSSDAARGWGQGGSHDAGSTAFSSWGNHSGSSSVGSGGWGDRSASSRGWGSRGGGSGWGGGGGGHFGGGRR